MKKNHQEKKILNKKDIEEKSLTGKNHEEKYLEENKILKKNSKKLVFACYLTLR